MADVHRITAIWQGFQGAPGYTKFSFMGLTDASALTAAATAVRTFFNGLATQLPSGSTVTVQSVAGVYDMANGMLIREDPILTPPAPVTGTATAGTLYSGGVGVYVTWLTGAVYNGHKVRGRTYLVPLVLGGASDGTLGTGTVTLVQNAANALVSSQAGKLAIWSKTFTKTEPITQIGGGLSTVTSANVPDKTGILRSRRD
jgi:hypothetical protein